jgi:hypothetical protein
MQYYKCLDMGHYSNVIKNLKLELMTLLIEKSIIRKRTKHKYIWMNIVVSKFSKELDKCFKLEQMFDHTTTKVLKDNTRLLMSIDLRGI